MLNKKKLDTFKGIYDGFEEQTNSDKIKIQREIISTILKYFASNKMDESVPLSDMVERVFELEMQKLGYKYKSLSSAVSDNIYEIGRYNEVILHDHVRDEESLGICEYYRQQENRKTIISWNSNYFYEKLQSDDKSVRLKNCKKLFKTIFHEIGHYNQHRLVETGVSSKDVLMYARDFALKEYLDEQFYSIDYDLGNYKALGIENDANEFGYKTYLDIMGNYKKIESLKNRSTFRKSLGRYKVNVSSYDESVRYYSHNLKDRDDISIEILDDLIINRKNIEILHKYPVLQKEYNLDGSKKNIYELIFNMQDEEKHLQHEQFLTDEKRNTLIKDSKEMYYELIYRAMKKSKNEQLLNLREQVGVKKCREIISEMKDYFNNQMQEKIEISKRVFEDHDEEYKNSRAKSYNKHMNRIFNKYDDIIDFVENVGYKVEGKMVKPKYTLKKVPIIARRFFNKYHRDLKVIPLKLDRSKFEYEGELMNKMEKSVEESPKFIKREDIKKYTLDSKKVGIVEINATMDDIATAQKNKERNKNIEEKNNLDKSKSNVAR